MEKDQGIQTYLDLVTTAQQATINSQMERLSAVAEKMVEVAASGKRIFIAGTGHSHMIAEEGHYRAGGLACVVPILASFLMIHESASLSTSYEKIPGIASVLLDRYDPQPGEIVFVFSYSGVNAAPVEIAQEAKARGTYVIGVSNLAYSQYVSGSSGKTKLADVADMMIDSGGRVGDALVDLDHNNWAIGPASTVLNITIWNALLTETATRLVARGIEPPIFISSKLEGAKEHNQRLVDEWKTKNPHL